MPAIKRPPKKPPGPRKALEAAAKRAAGKIMARQRESGVAAPSVPAVEFDDVTGWADVPKYTAPATEARRRFV